MSKNQPPVDPGRVIVEPGDSWDVIAERLDVDVDELLAVNLDLGRPAHRPPLVVGQELTRP